MSALDELKSSTPIQQLESAGYTTQQGTTANQSAEELNIFQLPTPIIESDKSFIEKYKNDKDIQRDKIKFSESTIEVDGLKFPRKIVKYDDIKNTQGLVLNHNVYQNNGHDYFTFDSIKRLGELGNKVPSIDQRQQAANVFKGNYGLLGQLLNYPKVGLRRSDSYQVRVGNTSSLYSSTPIYNNSAYHVWFNVDGSGNQDWESQGDARLLIFLQD